MIGQLGDLLLSALQEEKFKQQVVTLVVELTKDAKLQLAVTELVLRVIEQRRIIDVINYWTTL